MAFIKICIVVLVAGGLLQSCKDDNKTTIAVVPPAKKISDNYTFMFSENEQKLFQPSRGVPVMLNLDTVCSMAQIRKITTALPFNTAIAFAFTYRDGSSLPKVFHAVYRKSFTTSGGFNPKKILLVEIPDTAAISSYSSGYVEMDPDPDKMDSVVAVFLENAFAIDAKEDRSSYTYKWPGIELGYYHDDCTGIT
ncbi:MAG TPA: hypothetical protein VHM26_13065, partial [Chitinophagaceae bacterium]|nr:hypothetical protein [Chitinophagaceae bacterium]